MEFTLNIFPVDPRRLIFIDEAGVYLNMTRSYGWSKKGQRVYDLKPGGRSERLNIIGAMSLGGIIASMTVDGSVNSDVFIAYVEQVLVPVLKPNDLVVMDNLSVHKVKQVKQSINAVGADVVFLPPYSPELNPIEECWSKVKNILKSSPNHDRDSLDNSIAKAFDSLTRKDILGWFSHAGYRTIFE